jgi:hypothetical protein
MKPAIRKSFGTARTANSILNHPIHKARRKRGSNLIVEIDGAVVPANHNPTITMKNKLVGAAVCAFIATRLSAGVLLNDSFNYADGPIVGAPGSPWVSHSGAEGTALVTSGKLELVSSSTRTEDIHALLDGAPYRPDSQNKVLFATFTMMGRSLPTAGGSYFAHFKDETSTGFRCRIWISTANAASGRFRAGIGNSASSTATTAQFERDLALDTAYTLMVRYDVATGLSTLWIDPIAESDSSVTASDAVGIVSIHSFAFRQNTGIGTLHVDGLVVATSFAEALAGGTRQNPPVISVIPDQSIAANSSTGSIPFTISDTETPASSLTLSAASSNHGLIDFEGILFGGSGENRSVTIAPRSNAEGIARITITVTDEHGNNASSSFDVVVGAPFLSPILEQITAKNSPGAPIMFVAFDRETAPELLMISAESDNPSLVPIESIRITRQGANGTLVITPAEDATGLAEITVRLSDGIHLISQSFTFVVRPDPGLIFMDDFSYPDGPVAEGAAAYLTPWISHSGTLGETQVRSGKLHLSGSQTEDINVELPGRLFEIAGGTVLYASFLVEFGSLPTSGGSFFAHFKDIGNGFRGRLFANRAHAGPGHFRLGVANNTSSVTAGGQFPRDLATNTACLVVLRYNVATGRTALWIDPRDESDPHVLAPDDPAPMAVDSFAFRQSSGIGALTVDDLKIGGAFSDVVSAAPALPVLQIRRAEEQWILSWADGEQGFGLQTRNALCNAPGECGSWAAVSRMPVKVGGQFEVAIPVGETSAFFRLEKK